MDKTKLENLIEEGKKLLETKTTKLEDGVNNDYVDNNLFEKWHTKVSIILKNENLEEHIVKGTFYSTNYDIANKQLNKLEGIKEALF